MPAFRVIIFSASSSVAPPYRMVLAASWFRRRVKSSESLLIATRTPLRMDMTAFHGIASQASCLNPHQSAKVAMPTLFAASLIGDFVGFERVMEGAQLVAKFLRHRHLGQHFVGAIAVDLHHELAAQDVGQRFQLQIALWRLGVLVAVLHLGVVVRPSRACIPAPGPGLRAARRSCPCGSKEAGRGLRKRASDFLRWRT